MVAWLSGGVLVSINEVILCQGPVSIGIGDRTICRQVKHLSL